MTRNYQWISITIFLLIFSICIAFADSWQDRGVDSKARKSIKTHSTANANIHCCGPLGLASTSALLDLASSQTTLLDNHKLTNQTHLCSVIASATYVDQAIASQATTDSGIFALRNGSSTVDFKTKILTVSGLSTFTDELTITNGKPLQIFRPNTDYGWGILSDSSNTLQYYHGLRLGLYYRTAYSLTDSGNASFAGSITAGGNFVGNGHWYSGDGGDEGLFVDGSGNVGVGTLTTRGLTIDTPNLNSTSQLQLKNGIDSIVETHLGTFGGATYLGNNYYYNNGHLYNSTSIGSSRIYMSDVINFDVATASSIPATAMRINNAGHLLIQTITDHAGEALQVAGNTYVSGTITEGSGTLASKYRPLTSIVVSCVSSTTSFVHADNIDQIASWTEIVDTNNAFTNSIFTCPRTGQYLVSCNYKIETLQVAQYYYLFTEVNGTKYLADQYIALNTNPWVLGSVRLWSLTVGDTLAIVAKSSVSNPSSFNNDYGSNGCCYLSIVYQGD
ncbi:MAG: hypothetical protein HQM08_17465 [Candidatus Riflebacteria bacterium]|nr:hypothetical protein [Candidatus Riflebacteria bacterium]